LAQLELKKLIYGILKPFVTKQMTPQKTSQMIQKWARRKNFMVRWAVAMVPKRISHILMREKLAPAAVKLASSWLAKKIIQKSPGNIFELLKHHSIDFLSMINKADAHPPPHP
jgi:hypothetical protein